MFMVSTVQAIIFNEICSLKESAAFDTKPHNNGQLYLVWSSQNQSLELLLEMRIACSKRLQEKSYKYHRLFVTASTTRPQYSRQ